jgi:hypothetical protein
VLVAYRVAGLDWQLTNITTNATHHLISPSRANLNTTVSTEVPLTFELRVTNWAYGVQIAGVHLSSNASLIKIPDYGRRIEFIGDSLTSGYSATYEAFSGFGYSIGAGLGETEFSITAYPGICLHDANCWGNPRGQEYQWYRTTDTSPRAMATYNTTPPLWDFSSQPAADIVLINIGTNDRNKANPVTTAQYLQSYIDFIPKVHAVYPNAQIIIMGLWGTWSRVGNTWVQSPNFVDEIYSVYKKYESEGYVHYFNSTGILQHNDIGPRSHPTDFGHIKVRLGLFLFDSARVLVRKRFGSGEMNRGLIRVSRRLPRK